MIVNVIIAAAMVGTRFYVRWFVERQIAGYQNDLTQKHCQEVDNLYRQTRGWRHGSVSRALVCNDEGQSSPV